MDIGMAIFAVAVFIAVVLGAEGAWLLWNDLKGPEVLRLERRLRMLSAGSHSDEALSLLRQRNLSRLPWLERLLMAVPRVSSLDRWLQQTGVAITVARFLMLPLALGLAAGVCAWLLGLPPGAMVLIAVLAGAVPVVGLAHVRAGRLRTLDQQLPDALDFIGRALRAGHAFPAALQMVATEAAEPLAGEFGVAFEEINYGVSVSDAMLNLATRVPSIDLRYFVVSVLLQRETGGNLAELLGNLSRLIRERYRVLGQVRVLATEGRLSAQILVAMPFVVGVAIYLLNPGFLAVLWTDPAGRQAIGAALGLMLVGGVWMSRIVRIRI